MKPQDIIAGKSSLWIFGYGSLVWKPDFKYKRSHVGFIRGYKRRFWHGDTFHRGSDEMPGRVVTLLEEDDACTWGVAFEVTGSQIEECLAYLNIREAVRGGYGTRMVEFIPRRREPALRPVSGLHRYRRQPDLPGSCEYGRDRCSDRGVQGEDGLQRRVPAPPG
ncbi:hypothetical protein PHYPO_G00097560 [Pangasianodon hypophthalmus]|uniref:Gamma-glutamylcyclotransferase n=1 Tax=Pangasianodon hypophthalmus TaxID=310915 RepID=A0A5N5LBV9_PANHP|nr:hypothetical protein PHYPO_G00097560 [Pangasianodon hypophthalmus]